MKSCYTMFPPSQLMSNILHNTCTTLYLSTDLCRRCLRCTIWWSHVTTGTSLNPGSWVQLCLSVHLCFWPVWLLFVTLCKLTRFAIVSINVISFYCSLKINRHFLSLGCGRLRFVFSCFVPGFSCACNLNWYFRAFCFHVSLCFEMVQLSSCKIKPVSCVTCSHKNINLLVV